MYACVCTCARVCRHMWDFCYFTQPTWNALVKTEDAFDHRLVSLGLLYSLVDPRQRIFMPLFNQSLFVFRNKAVDPDLMSGKGRVVIFELDL